MPTKSAVEAAIGADDELGEELLESLRDTVRARSSTFSGLGRIITRRPFGTR
jgi:hypothetical protein